jgi:hypothetical protein
MKSIELDNDTTYFDVDGNEISRDAYDNITKSATRLLIEEENKKREEALTQLAKATGLDIEVLRLI